MRPIGLLAWLKEVVAAAGTTFELKEKLCNIKFFHWKKRTFAEEMESKLEQYCKESKEILIHEELSK